MSDGEGRNEELVAMARAQLKWERLRDAAPEMRAILDEFMRGIQPPGDDGRVRVDGAFLLGVREKIAALLARLDGPTPPAP